MGSIVVVCTGNINRSPVAAAMLTRKLGDRYQVSSAGLAAAGVEPPARLLKAAARHNLDLASHRSTKLTAEHIDEADLVLCMDKTHPPKIAAINAAASENTFLITEALAAFTARTWVPLDVRVKEAVEPRTTKQFLWPKHPDVEDPQGRRQAVFNKVVDELARITDSLGNRIRFG